MPVDLNKIISDYNAGKLSGRQKEIAEELGRRNVINISAPESGYSVTTIPQAIGTGANVGMIELLGLPVTAVESALKIANIGLEKVGLPESVRIPVSERGLTGTIREALKEPGYTYSSISDVSPSVRPAAVFGEVLGGAAIPAAAPVGIARTLPATGRFAGTAADIAGDVGTLRQVGRSIVESAAESPGRFLATEAALAGISGAGGAVAETMAPGDVTARIVGEIAPAISPALIASRFLPNTINKLLDITAPVNPMLSKKRASDKVLQLAKEYGEDPNVIIKSLTSESAKEVDSLTAAQMSESKMLTDLENYLIKESSLAGEAYKLKAKESAEKINDLYRQALLDGDSSQVFLAAQERKDYLINLLDNRVARADKKARDLLGPVQAARPKSEISVEAREVIESALADARATEDSLWKIIPQNIDVIPKNLSSSLRKYKSEILDERMLPAPTERFALRVARVEEQNIDQQLANQVFSKFDIEDIAPSLESVTTGDLLDFRKIALRKARQLRSGANPDYDTARIMQGLADAVLDDLSVLPGNQVDIAREFSYQLNNKFSKTFAADILGITARGRVKVEPELTLTRTMQAGGPQAEVRARQLEEAVAPIQGMVAQESIIRPTEMRNAQQEFLLSMANSVKDPKTQELNSNRLAKFISDNQGNIQRLGMTDSFKDMQSARKAYETSLSVQKNASAFFDKKKIAGRIIKAGEEGVDKFVAKIINNSTNKTKDLRDLFRLVAGNKDAAIGLRSSIFQNIIDNGYDPVTGVLSGVQIKSYLNKTYAGEYTLKEALLKSGALTPGQMRRIDLLANKADRFNLAVKSNESAEEFFKKQGPINYIFSMMTRTLGARLGATSPMARGSGATLIFASEGRKLAEKVFSYLPKMRINDVLIEATISNPGLMVDLLSAPKAGAGARLKTMQQIEAYLIQAGIVDKESEE